MIFFLLFFCLLPYFSVDWSVKDKSTTVCHILQLYSSTCCSDYHSQSFHLLDHCKSWFCRWLKNENRLRFTLSVSQSLLYWYICAIPSHLALPMNEPPVLCHPKIRGACCFGYKTQNLWFTHWQLWVVSWKWRELYITLIIYILYKQ